MDVNDLLARLDGVRGRNGQWQAKCPAHADRSPSLSVKDGGNGLILMHCFGGCGTDAVLEALGLTLTDLFPERLGDFPARRGALSAMDALRALTFESSVVAIESARLAEGFPVDASRIALAAGRIADALEFVHGS